MLDTICDLLDASPLGHERFLGAFGAFRSNMQDAEDVNGEVHNQFIFVAKPNQTIGAHPLHPIADLNLPGHDWIIKSLVENIKSLVEKLSTTAAVARANYASPTPTPA